MSLRRITFLTLVLFLAIISVASARSVFVVPPPNSSASVMGFNDQLQPMGALTLPAGTVQALTTKDGDRAIFISTNPATAVTFISIASGVFTGSPRTLALDGLPASMATITRDGQYLLVIAGNNPGKLFVVDLITEQVRTGGSFSVGLNPKDFAVSPDSRYAYVAAPNLLTIVDLVVGQTTTKTLETNLVNAVTVGPDGNVYVTSQYRLEEFDPLPPFDKKGFTGLNESPGKLTFSPDGRWFLTGNVLPYGPSVLLFDRTLPGENLVNQPVSMKLVNRITVVEPGTSTRISPDRILNYTEERMLMHFLSTGRLFEVTVPGLVAAPASIGPISSTTLVAGVALSNEFPAARALYFTTTAGILTRQNLGSTAMPDTRAAVPGAVELGSELVPGPAARYTVYNANQTVGPNRKLKPYAVRFRDELDRPVFDLPVTFAPGDSSVQISATSGRTNLDGLVLVTATSPTVNGAFVVRVQAGNLSLDITSTVTGGTSPGGGGGGGGGGGSSTPTILKLSGDGQLTIIYNSFVRPFVVKVLDGEGKPIAGRRVTWTGNADVRLTGTPETFTNTEGIASMGWFPTGLVQTNEAYINYEVTASVDQVGSVIFYAKGFAIARPTVYLIAPDPARPRIDIKVGEEKAEGVVIDVITSLGPGAGGGVQNVGVQLIPEQVPAEGTADTGPIAVCKENIAMTNAQGRSRCTVIVKQAPPITSTEGIPRGFIIDVGGGYAEGHITVYFKQGDPVVPVVVDGNNQRGRPGETLPKRLIAKIVDAVGNPIAGAQVNWEVVTPTGSSSPPLTLVAPKQDTSDQNGQVFTTVQLGPNPGSYQVRVRTANGKEKLFDVTIVTTLASIDIVDGDNQIDVPVGTEFPKALIVRVLDTAGSPVRDQTVVFALATGSVAATIVTPNATTDVNGRASTRVIAGATAGTIVITATVATLPSRTFRLTTRLPGPSVTAAGFTNYATGENAIAPGLLVKITGTNLVPSISGEFWANMLLGSLPREMKGVAIEFTWAGGGRDYAPILAVGNTSGQQWVIAQVPFEMNGTTAGANVRAGAATTAVTGIPVRPVAPGILEESYSDGGRLAIAIDENGLLVTSSNRAQKGKTIRVYVIGLGQTTSPPAVTNVVGGPNQVVAAPVIAGLEGGRIVRVVSAKMAENLIGIYEVLVEIPSDAPSGILSFAVAVGDPAVWSVESRIPIE